MSYISQNKYAIIVAAGSGMRMGGEIPKQFQNIGGRPILMHTLEKFYLFEKEINIILVLPSSQIPFWDSLCLKFNFQIKHQKIEGGETRFESVKNGLMSIQEDGIVAIHDGVRPFVSIETIGESFKIASEKGNAISSVKLKDSIRLLGGENANKALDRSKWVLIQTPQTFKISLLKKAFESPENEHFTDDATVLETLGEKINLIEGSYHNIKLTTPEDLLFAEAILLSKQKDIGHSL